MTSFGGNGSATLEELAASSFMEYVAMRRISYWLGGLMK